MFNSKASQSFLYCAKLHHGSEKWKKNTKIWWRKQVTGNAAKVKKKCGQKKCSKPKRKKPDEIRNKSERGRLRTMIAMTKRSSKKKQKNGNKTRCWGIFYIWKNSLFDFTFPSADPRFCRAASGNFFKKINENFDHILKKISSWLNELSKNPLRIQFW